VKGKLRFHSPLPLLIKLYCPDVKRLACSFCKGENYDYLFSTLNKSFPWFICDCLSITEEQVLLICATLDVKREKENDVHLEEQKVLALYSRFKNEVIIKRNKKKKLDFFFWIWCFLKSGVNTTLNFDRCRWLRTLNSVVPKPEHISFHFCTQKRQNFIINPNVFNFTPNLLEIGHCYLPWTWNIDAKKKKNY
jgi:hypothetical protein